MGSSTRRAHYRVTFVVLAIGTGAYALLQSLVAPVLPLLQTDLHTTQDNVTWVLTAYLLSASVFTPILGRIGDMVGKEKVLVGVLAALAVGSVLAAVSGSIMVMIVARAIQGIGGGLVPLTFGIIRDEFPREKVTGAVGIMAALLAVGGGLGLVLAGPIVNALNYHWLFWIPGIAVALCAVATHFVVPESPVRTPGRINWPAAGLLSGWLVALMVAVSEAPVWGWVSGSVIGLLVLGIVLAAAWVVVELRATEPLIDMRMMRIPAVWTTNLVAMLVGVGMYAVFAFLPQFVQTPSSAGYGFGASVTQSGLIVLPMAVTMFAAGTVSGPLSARFGSKAVLIAGAGLSVVPFVIMAAAHARIWEIVVAVTLLGVGIGLAFSTMSSIVVDAVPMRQTGVASGMNANIRTIGGSLGAALMGSIVTSHAAADGVPKESGYTAGFAMLAAASLLAALAGLLIPRHTRSRGVVGEEQEERTAPSHEETHEEEATVLASGAVMGDDAEE